jgi:transposase
VQDDCITVMLGLPQLRIIGQEEKEEHFEVKVIYRRTDAICPRCGQVTNKVHDQRLQCKQDRKLRDKTVFLWLIKRRFRCVWCNKVFTEDDEVFGHRRRSSKRFREYLGEEGLHQTVKRTAQEEAVGEGLVRRCVAEKISKELEARGNGETPQFIGLDEFSVSGQKLYHTAICNLDKSEVMEVVAGHGKQKVEEYLNTIVEPEKVKAVSMDMHEPFRQAVEMSLPQAEIVIDKFHVIRHINNALDKVRSRAQGGNSKNKKRELFESRYKLLRGAERLDSEGRNKLVELFPMYPEVKEAWIIKEKFRVWYRETDKKKAAFKLQEIEDRIKCGGIPELKDILVTLNNWRDGILNYFEYRITNGFVEGKNNRIKTIKRMAYGYRNMANFRLRILATNFKDDRLAVSHLLT